MYVCMRERESECVCVCVCVCMRERESVCVCDVLREMRDGLSVHACMYIAKKV